MELEEIERKLKEIIRYRDSLEYSRDYNTSQNKFKIDYLNDIIDELITKRVMLINELPNVCLHQHLYFSEGEIVCLDCGMNLLNLDADLSNFDVLEPADKSEYYLDELLMIYDKLKEYKTESEAYQELANYNSNLKKLKSIDYERNLVKK